MANVQDGIFEVIDGVFREIRDANLSRQDLAAITSMVERAKEGAISKVEMDEQIAGVNTDVGAVFRRLPNKGPLAAILALILIFLNQCTVTVDGKVDFNQLFDQMFGQPLSQELPDHSGGGLHNAEGDEKATKPDPTSGGTGTENPNVGTHDKPPKKKSRRRADVRRQRRAELRRRRETFNPRER